MGKRYFWLKLKDDFFNQKEIKMLRRLAGGDTYTIIYLKILLLSLKNDGRVYYDGVAKDMVEEISLEIDEEIENVQIAFNYMQSKGLLVFNTDDEIELSNIHQMIGSESASASRVRKHRTKKALQSNTEVTKVKRLSNTEIEIEKEIEIENIKHSCSKQVLTERFEIIWKEYPSKKGKDKAFKSYEKAIKAGVTDEIILDGIRRYNREIKAKGTDKQFIANGSTWFNQKRWEDEYDTSVISNGQGLSLSREFEDDDLPF